VLAAGWVADLPRPRVNEVSLNPERAGVDVLTGKFPVTRPPYVRERCRRGSMVPEPASRWLEPPHDRANIPAASLRSAVHCRCATRPVPFLYGLAARADFLISPSLEPFPRSGVRSERCHHMLVTIPNLLYQRLHRRPCADLHACVRAPEGDAFARRGCSDHETKPTDVGYYAASASRRPPRPLGRFSPLKADERAWMLRVRTRRGPLRET